MTDHRNFSSIAGLRAQIFDNAAIAFSIPPNDPLRIILHRHPNTRGFRAALVKQSERGERGRIDIYASAGEHVVCESQVEALELLLAKTDEGVVERLREVGRPVGRPFEGPSGGPVGGPGRGRGGR